MLFTLASSNEAQIYFIEIYFDTSTFDKVEQDKKTNLVLSLRISKSKAVIDTRNKFRKNLTQMIFLKLYSALMID